MVQLGKYLKGRAPTKEQKKGDIIRIRHYDDMENRTEIEMNLMNVRKEALKQQVAEEAQLARLNRMKFLQIWRKTLRLTKTEALKKQIQIYQQNHDREVDAKDAILQMLDRDLDEAEEQYQMALRNHLMHMDDLIALQQSRLRGLNEEFERDTRILKNEFDQEKNEIERSHDAETQELTEMIQTIQEEEENKLKNIRDSFMAEKEQVKNKNSELQDNMKMDLVRKINELDHDFEVQFRRYLVDTEQRTAEYSNLVTDNVKTSEYIGELSQLINNARNKTQQWSLKILQQKRECEDRTAQIRKERETITRHYHDLKRKMAQQRNEKEGDLGTLSTNSLRCMETLKDYQKIGERILKTAELCRKLETEKEKVLPFYQSDPDSMEQAEVNVEKIAGLDANAYNEFQMLDSFYKRFNKVHLDKLAIQKQKATLEKENLFFKNLLKQYLDGVSVNDDVINNNNPLLVVNNRVNLNRPPVIQEDGAHTTYIEGNTVVNDISRQRNPNLS